MLLYWLCFIYVSILLIIFRFSYFIYFIFVSSKNPFQSFLFQNDRWFVLCLLTPYLSIFYVFYEKNLMLLNLINRYVTSTSHEFLKSKDIMEPCKVYFWYWRIIHSVNTDNCREHITGGVNIYVYVYILSWVSVYWPLCLLYICVCACDIKSEY